MFDWFAELILAVSGNIANLFIARDSANFGILQLAVSLFVITACIISIVFWRSFAALFRSGTGLRKQGNNK